MVLVVPVGLVHQLYPSLQLLQFDQEDLLVLMVLRVQVHLGHLRHLFRHWDQKSLLCQLLQRDLDYPFRPALQLDLVVQLGHLAHSVQLVLALLVHQLGLVVMIQLGL